MSDPVSRHRLRRARGAASTPPTPASHSADRIPGGTWLCALAIWTVSMLLIQRWGDGPTTLLVEGQLAPSSILAEVDFEAEDSRATQLAADAAASSIPPVFRVDPSLIRLRDMDLVFDAIQQSGRQIAAGVPRETAAAGLARVLSDLDIRLDPLEVIAAIPTNQVEAARAAMDASLSPLAMRGVISTADRATLFGGKASRGQVMLIPPGSTVPMPRLAANLTTVEEARAEAFRRLFREVPATSNLWMPFLHHIVAPTIQYEPELTRASVEHARKSVEPIRVMLRRGAVLVEAGARVNTATLALLQSHAAAARQQKDYQSLVLATLGRGALLAALLPALGIILAALKSPTLGRPRQILTAGVVSATALALANGLLLFSGRMQSVSLSLVQFALPFALAPLVISILSPGPGALALVTGIWTSACLAVMLDYNLQALLLGIIITSLAILTGRHIQRRSTALRSGLLIGVVQAGYALSSGVLHQQDISRLPAPAGVAFLAGIITAYLAVQIVPLFERRFGVTTDLHLLHLTDLSHPLLQRLSLEAPGTYHHSLMVANLGRAASAHIGANELLVRAAAYFHDIGKLSKPDFFIENVPYRQNPHDDLSPSMSSLVIISHVKEGMALALRHKLPQVILDGIEQHHGTSLVGYFYHRAVEESKTQDRPPATVAPEQFRYPGPRPHTVEMAILLLADTIEAASRSLQKPTPGNIERMVNDLVAEKVADGQLDDCGITFAQLAAVRRSFTLTLNNMLHPRIAYPREHHTDQPSETLSRTSRTRPEAVRSPAAPG